MKKLIFGWNQYFKPTPKNVKKFADALVTASTFAGTIVILNGHALAGTIIFIIGTVAKFVSSFFGTEQTPTNNEQP
jgi:hypothetical protein